MRYITQQQHSKSCGPVATMNALKWLGEKISYREDIEEFKTLGWKIDDGRYLHELCSDLSYFNVKYKVHHKPTVSSMKKIINKGNAIIFDYDWIDETGQGGHYIFMDSYDDSDFKAYNITSKESEDNRFSFQYTELVIYISHKLQKNNTGIYRKGAIAIEIKK